MRAYPTPASTPATSTNDNNLTKAIINNSSPTKPNPIAINQRIPNSCNVTLVIS